MSAQPLGFLNYHHLYYFWNTARTGSVRRAAEQLRLDHSTLSKQISSLEEYLGGVLFLRSRRNVSLTPLGQEVLVFADEIFRAGNALLEMVRGQQSAEKAPLRLGIASGLPKEISDGLLQPALAILERERIYVREDGNQNLLDALVAGELHGVISDQVPRLGAGSNFFARTIGESKVALYGTPDLVQRHAPEFPDSLDEAPMLLPSADSCLRRLILEWLARHGLQVRIAGEFESAALMQTYGREGKGVFPMLSVPAARPEQPARPGLIGELHGVSVPFYAILAERRVRHPALRGILERARQRPRARG